MTLPRRRTADNSSCSNQSSISHVYTDGPLVCNEMEGRQMTPNPTKRKRSANALRALLEDPRVRTIEHEGQTWYAAEDVVAVLSDSAHPADLWTDLKGREPKLEQVAERLETPIGDILEMLLLDGVL